MTGASRLEGAYAYCETLLRDHDKDRYLANLFIPAAFRRHVSALQAFSFEIARLRDVIHEPMAGEMRQQWWQDAIEDRARGDAAANPVALALIDTIARFGLAPEPLVALIEARGFDLYDDPMPDMATLEAYCRDTCSVLFEMVARILSLPKEGDSLAEATFHAGCAYAFTGLIRALPLHAARGQVYLPGDLLKRHGLSRDDVISAPAAPASPALIAAIADWRKEARRHLSVAREAIVGLPEAVKSAFLPLALVQPYLRLTEQRGYEPFRTPLELSQWRRQWALWRG